MSGLDRLRTELEAARAEVGRVERVLVETLRAHVDVRLDVLRKAEAANAKLTVFTMPMRRRGERELAYLERALRDVHAWEPVDLAFEEVFVHALSKLEVAT